MLAFLVNIFYSKGNFNKAQKFIFNILTLLDAHFSRIEILEEYIDISIFQQRKKAIKQKD